jgi:hypothetical protein
MMLTCDLVHIGPADMFRQMAQAGKELAKSILVQLYLFLCETTVLIKPYPIGSPLLSLGYRLFNDFENGWVFVNNCRYCIQNSVSGCPGHVAIIIYAWTGASFLSQIFNHNNFSFPDNSATISSHDSLTSKI